MLEQLGPINRDRAFELLDDAVDVREPQLPAVLMIRSDLAGDPRQFDLLARTRMVVPGVDS